MTILHGNAYTVANAPAKALSTLLQRLTHLTLVIVLQMSPCIG